jgi:hypothetical protein
MQKLFEKLISALKSHEAISSYFHNYFYIKEPIDPALPYILFKINNIKSLCNDIFSSKWSNSSEIDFSLILYSNDFEPELFVMIESKIRNIIANLVFFEDSFQISFSFTQSDIQHIFERKKNKDNDFFKIEILLKAFVYSQLE